MIPLFTSTLYQADSCFSSLPMIFIAARPQPTLIHTACVAKGFGSTPGDLAQGGAPHPSLYPGLAWQGHTSLYHAMSREPALAEPGFVSSLHFGQVASILSAPAALQQQEQAFVHSAFVHSAGPPVRPRANLPDLGAASQPAGEDTAAAPRQEGEARVPVQSCAVADQPPMGQPV